MVAFGCLIPQHAIHRFHQRTDTNDSLKEFLAHMRDHLCVVIYELVRDGCVNGTGKRLKFGANRFVVTFDEDKQLVVLKTILQE